MSVLGLVIVGVFGLVFGSFATVVVVRVPAGGSIVSPGSACPACGQPVAWYDNVPVISYALLGGKCRACREPISLRYPLIELTMAAVWVLLADRIGWHPELVGYLAFGTALVILSFIDLATHRLPNKVLGPAALVAAVCFLGAALVHSRWTLLEHGLIGAAAYGLPMLVLGLAAPSAMGGGDVKFAPYLGFHLGWIGLRVVLSGALLGVFAGGLGGAVLLLFGRKGMKDAIPFGPFMAFGAFIAVLLGAGVVRPLLG